MVLMVVLLTLSPLAISGNNVQQSKLLKLTVTLWLFDNDTVRLDVTGLLNKGAGSLCIEFPLLEWGRYYAVPHIKKITVIHKKPSELNASITSNKLYARSLLLCFPEKAQTEYFEASIILDKRIYIVSETKATGRTRVVLPIVLPNISVDLSNIRARMVLPRNSTISPTGSVRTNISILTDNQGNLIVEFPSPVLRWVAPSPFHEQYIYLLSYLHRAANVSALNTSPQRPTNNMSSGGSNNQLLSSRIIIAIGAVLSATLLVAILVKIRERKRNGGEISSKVVFPPIGDVSRMIRSLDKDEFQLLKVLAEHPDALKQKDLPSMTGFSKSKVSRILKKLSAMGIIVRESQRKTKVVWLNPAVREHLAKHN